MSEGFSFEGGGKGYRRVFGWKGEGSDAANII